MLVEPYFLLRGLLGEGRQIGIHDLTDLVKDEVAILQHLIPHTVEWLVHAGGALSPNVASRFHIDQLSLVFVNLSLLNHVSSTLAALHDKLVKDEIVKVDGVNILGKLHVPAIGREAHSVFEDLIKLGDVAIFNLKEQEVEAMFERVRPLHDALELFQLVPTAHAPGVLDFHLEVSYVNVAL
jgi:hypothetical protein